MRRYALRWVCDDGSSSFKLGRSWDDYSAHAARSEALRAEIRKCRSLTDKPFGVNITLLPALAPPDYPSFIRVIIEEGVKIVETAGRSPAEIIKALKNAGIIVIHKCVALRHALTAQRLGADIVSIDGFDCAGHPGEDVGNWVLLPIAGLSRDLTIPFMASGGVGTAEQFAAALALGAEGVNMGTRFMATKECPIHENIKRALVDGDERSTTHIFRTMNNTERVFKNKITLKIREIEAEHPGDFMKIRPYVRGEMYRKSFQETGNTDDSAWSAGTVMGLIDDVPTCRELVERMVTGASEIIEKHFPRQLLAKL